MTSRKKEDYIEVFRSVMRVIRVSPVQRIILDFERGAWEAIRVVFPGVHIQGCIFHYTQVVIISTYNYIIFLK